MGVSLWRARHVGVAQDTRVLPPARIAAPFGVPELLDAPTGREPAAGGYAVPAAGGVRDDPRTCGASQVSLEVEAQLQEAATEAC